MFSGVLGLFAPAGLVSVEAVAIDCTNTSANASINANREVGAAASLTNAIDHLHGELE